MAYITGYTYDIFISYAHIDNRPTSWENLGWIEKFHKDLETLLARRVGRPDAIKIWWDKRRLDGNVLFDHSIEEGIRHSAIMICLTSPGYLASDYCKKELDLFYKKAQQENIGLKVGNRSRILNVLLNNIPFDEWPKELSGVSGFAFHNARHKEDFGDPLDTTLPQFRNQFQQLRDAIIKLMNEFPKEGPLSISEAETEKKEEGFTIFFGDVADSLRSMRKRAITELEKNGYRVISNIPPPDELNAHEQKATQELKKADLAIHLLDQYPGREINGVADIWYPQKQAELSLEHAKSKLIWVPSELDLMSVEEEKYKEFLQAIEAGTRSAEKYEYIRGAKSTLSQEITEFAGQVKAMQLQQHADKNKVSVLLDTHFNDQLYAMDLSRKLLDNEIQSFINPQEDDPRKNINVLADRISKVSKLIFFYGKVSRDWVFERMSAALQLIVTNNFPVEDFFIFLAPPHKDPGEISLKQRFLQVNVVDNSDNSYISPTTLDKLLKNLRR